MVTLFAHLSDYTFGSDIGSGLGSAMSSASFTSDHKSFPPTIPRGLRISRVLTIQPTIPALLHNELQWRILCHTKELRYESSTLILYKELSSPIFQSLSVSQASVTPVQISTLFNI